MITDKLWHLSLDTTVANPTATTGNQVAAGAATLTRNVAEIPATAVMDLGTGSKIRAIFNVTDYQVGYWTGVEFELLASDTLSGGNVLNPVVIGSSAVLTPAQVGITNIACTVANATETFTSNGHGLQNGNAIWIAGSTTPAGITPSTTYYVINRTDNTFQVSASFGGAAVNVTSDGADVVVRRQYRAFNGGPGHQHVVVEIDPPTVLPTYKYVQGRVNLTAANAAGFGFGCFLAIDHGAQQQFLAHRSGIVV